MIRSEHAANALLAQRQPQATWMAPSTCKRTRKGWLARLLASLTEVSHG